jgi:plastocyanin
MNFSVKNAFFSIAAAACCAGCFGSDDSAIAPAPAPKPAPLQVNMTAGDLFSPTDLVVQQGQTITWTNTDNEGHTASKDPEFANMTGPDSDSKYPHGVPPGGSYSWVVPASVPHGTLLHYMCRFHVMMKGTIKVQ